MAVKPPAVPVSKTHRPAGHGGGDVGRGDGVRLVVLHQKIRGKNGAQLLLNKLITREDK